MGEIMREEVTLTRRRLLEGMAFAGMAATAGGLILSEAACAAGDGPVAEGEAENGVQYGFLVNTGRCVNCGKCVKACRAHNHTPEDMPARRKVVPYESDFGMKVYVSTSCMHCSEPACAQVCPAHAITKRPDGIVVVDSQRCIGCKYCFQACPFEVPHYGEEGMDKCDCCLEAGIPAGDEPYCAQACMFGGLSYGKMDELMALNHGTATRVEASTGPSCLLL